jgi:excisionase family DNA binding protein
MDQQQTPTPWRTVSEAAARAQTGTRLIYREAKAGRLKAARVGGRRELRFRDAWIDAWLESTAEPHNKG